MADIKSLLEALASGLHERDLALRLGLCAALGGESVFLLGPPGTGKSLLARRMAQAFRGARFFDYLMGRFSTPEEIFGPLSIAALRDQDRYERQYRGYLPEADIAFLDEVWKASPPIQNALLTALNEKLWRNGTEMLHLPLRCLVGASNEVAAQEEGQGAFWDRFLVRVETPPLQTDEAFLALLSDPGHPLDRSIPPTLQIDSPTWTAWMEACTRTPPPPEALEVILRLRQGFPARLGRAGPSDRRWKKTLALATSCALMHGRSRIEAPDLLVLPWCLWEEASELPELIIWVQEVLSRVYTLEHPLVRALAHDGPELGSLRKKTPPLVDGEYYTLYPGTDRIWMGDWDYLAQEEGGSIDVISPGSPPRSRTVFARRGKKPWTVRIEDRTWSLFPPDSGEVIADATAGVSRQSALHEARLWRRHQEDLWRGHLLAELLDTRRVFVAVDRILGEETLRHAPGT